MPAGRPSVYSEEYASKILARLADGQSLRSICKDETLPARTTVYEWVFADTNGFASHYARAREMQAHSLQDDLNDIADDGSNDWMERNEPDNPGWQVNGEHIQRSKLRIDARKWSASKILPKAYGDRVATQQLDKEGNPTDPIAPVLNVRILGGDEPTGA